MGMIWGLLAEEASGRGARDTARGVVFGVCGVSGITMCPFWVTEAAALVVRQFVFGSCWTTSGG